MLQDAIAEEQELLGELPRPGNPLAEEERKAEWLSLPMRARVAVRRLHRNMRHLPKSAIIQTLGISSYARIAEVNS